MTRNFSLSFEKPSGHAPRKSNIYYFQSGGASPSVRRPDSQASNPALFIHDKTARGQFLQALIDVTTVVMWLAYGLLACLCVAVPFLVVGLLLFF